MLGAAACWGWIPACAGTTDVGVLRGWGWIPACAGTTGVCGWLRVGDGFPPARERRQSHGRRRRRLGWVPACAGTTDVGVPACWGWVPACGGNDGCGGACVLGMGSCLRGNDGCGGGCVLGMGSRLGGNDGCLGACVLGMDSRLRVHDGCWRGGCAGMMEVGASVRDMAEVRAGRDAVTVTVIPVEMGIQAPQIPHLTLLRAVSCAFRGVRVSTWIDA